MQKTTLAVVVAFLGCMWIAAAGEAAKPEAQAKTLTIAAAASMKFALDEIVPAFEKKNPGISVKVSTGASGTLVTQISQGAPFDIFLSADTKYPQEVIKAGKAAGDSAFTYAVGSIIIWTLKDSPIDIEKLGIQSLTQEGVKKIAIANPDHAPYGKAAIAAMKQLGVYEAVSNKVVMGENIAQALQFTESGNAEVGIFAFSLVTTAKTKDKGKYWVVPATAFPKIEQAGVILSGSKNLEAALEFKKFLLGADGREILKKHGFALPDE